MKKLLFVLGLSALISSCAVNKYYESQYVLDYRPYIAEGFVITPMSTIDKPHVFVGGIIMEFYPGEGKAPEYNDVRIVGGAGSLMRVPAYYYDYIPSPQEILKKIVDQAKTLGANGIVSLSEINGCIDATGRPGLRISGYAIKTKE